MSKPLTLTKELVKEFNSARSLVVRRDRKGAGLITLHFDDYIRGKKIETSKSYLCQVDLGGYACKDYDTQEVYLHKPEGNECCVTSLSLYGGHHAKGILSTLKADDVISFKFSANTSSVYAGKAKLFVDELSIEIRRGDKPRQEFMLDYGVNPGNSARMINKDSFFSSDIDVTSRDIENKEAEVLT